jgi:hypothetical protein
MSLLGWNIQTWAMVTALSLGTIAVANRTGIARQIKGA